MMCLAATTWLKCAVLSLAATAPVDSGNRLTHLDDAIDPYWVNRQTPRLTTPQWIGHSGVEAVIVLSIDDLSTERLDAYEAFLRPVFERLKRIDGRAAVSIMTKYVDPKAPQIRAWIEEGVSIEPHTYNHPCPCLKDGRLAAAKQTFDASIDVLGEIPDWRPVAFRMPCCDSMNSTSPRYFAELFNRTTPSGRFLAVDSSVFHVPAADGRSRFHKYLPADRDFANWVEGYPYPYVIGRLCWEVTMAVPSDWQAQHYHQPANPKTVADWLAAVDAAVKRQGCQSIIFHPHGWIRNDQVVELIDAIVARHGRRVKFLNMQEVQRRLTQNLLGGHPLRNQSGGDNGVRVLDVNNDGFMDVVIGNAQVRQTRIWDAKGRRWRVTDFPVAIVRETPNARTEETGVRFGVLSPDGSASVLVHNEQVSGLWHFDGAKWVRDETGLAGLTADGPIFTARDGRDRGVRLRDIDADGRCELIVANPRQNAIFSFVGGAKSPAGRAAWTRLPYALPANTAIVDAAGRDAGLRWVDLDGDGYDDIVFSNARRHEVDLFCPVRGSWPRQTIAGSAYDPAAIPPIVRADGTNNGVWFHQNSMWAQNEDTGAAYPNHVVRRRFSELLETDR